MEKNHDYYYLTTNPKYCCTSNISYLLQYLMAQARNRDFGRLSNKIDQSTKNHSEPRYCFSIVLQIHIMPKDYRQLSYKASYLSED